MKIKIAILILSLAFIGNMHANSFEFPNSAIQKIRAISIEEMHPDIIELLEDGIISTLTISNYTDASCTLSAEISYNGVALKLSITAETCYKAGEGLAQAVKGFMKGVK
ncbi:MAG: hypothetical protein MUO53_15665 [Maribacter sp.]|nr:hypothetical protein [Maribacter sp.]